jgi:hypothetical protein
MVKQIAPTIQVTALEPTIAVKQIALTVQVTDFQQSLAKQIEPSAFQYEGLSIAILLISISTCLGEHRILHSSGLYCLKLGKLWLGNHEETLSLIYTSRYKILLKREKS